MISIRTVRQLCTDLAKVSPPEGNFDPTRALDILKVLAPEGQALAVPREALLSTPVGRLVGKLRKQGGELGSLAWNLVNAWKAREALALRTSQQRQRVPATHRYAITFGEVAILHVGGDEIGKGRREEG